MRRILILIAVLLSAVAIGDRGAIAAGDLEALTAQSNRAYDTGRYLDAIPIAEKIVALTRERYGEADARYAGALNALATYLQLTGSLDRAEQLLRQSLAITQKALGPDHPDVATRQANLALVLLDKDQSGEAAELLHQALAIVERQPVSQQRGITLSNFAAVLERLNRREEAEKLYQAAIAALRALPGDNRGRLATALGNLGILFKSQHRLVESRPLLEEAVTILEGLSAPNEPSPRLATALNNLATLHEDQGEYAEAERLYRRALDLDRAMFGPDNPRLATRLNNLGGMYIAQGRHDDAMRELKEAMRIDRAAYGDDHPVVANVLLNGARLFSAKKEWKPAYTLIGRAVEIMEAADTRRATAAQGRIEAGRDIPDVTLSQIVYTTFLQISGEWPWSDTTQFAKLGGPAFDVAQRQVAPAAAAAIARIAARYASGKPELAAKVRRQQELTEQWNRIETSIIAQLAAPAGRIDRPAVDANRQEQARLGQELKNLAEEIGRGSEPYAALTAGKVLTIERVQELLSEDEALVYFADDAVHIHAFFITKEKAAWMPLAFTTSTIGDHVQALRCGLDAALWLGEDAERCLKLLHINYTEDDLQRGEELPFDLARSHELYQALFGTLGSLVAGKRLIVAPTGALATLPFQVLLTEPPDPTLPRAERYRKAAWLIRKQPITVLPSVASLEALRSAVPPSRAPQPFLGIGNPLLDGPQGAAIPAADRAQIRQIADLAHSKSACGGSAKSAPLTAMATASRGSRSAGVMAKSVRELLPLPDTADELCAIATALNVGADDVLLGSKATPAAIRDLSAKGTLANFDVVQFATHGLTAQELAGLTEPALALTPNDDANDNGLLTASDIAELRLNADWVVLSACNTAAGAAGDKEAFAGLARAFFLAGARALMVSHWPVYSEAALALTTGAFKALRAEPSIGRAEALRRSMLSLIDRGGVAARPAYWAPFIVLGEGG